MKLGVPDVFIKRPDSIKVKVSKKTILIRSTVDEGGRSNALKVSDWTCQFGFDSKIFIQREVKIPDGVNPKTLTVEAIKDKKCLILRCKKVQ